MMSPQIFPVAICFICGEKQHGHFTDPRQACGQHSNEERNFFMCMDKEGPRSKADRAMQRAYMLRWNKPYVQLHAKESR